MKPRQTESGKGDFPRKVDRKKWDKAWERYEKEKRKQEKKE